MTEDYKKIAESVRSGKYFTEARGWFEAVYIGPVSERSFFLIIAILASLTAFFGFASISKLLPVSSTQAVLVHATDRIDDVQMTLVPLAANHAAIDPAIAQFFLDRYVQMREGFDARHFLNDAKFIQSQSDTNTYNTYASLYSPANPQSPFAGMGEQGQRFVTVTSIKPVETKGAPAGQLSAIVAFSTETVGVANPETTKWTANIDYIYTGLVVNQDNKKPVLEVTDPHFQVVNYVLQQTQPAK